MKSVIAHNEAGSFIVHQGLGFALGVLAKGMSKFKIIAECEGLSTEELQAFLLFVANSLTDASIMIGAPSPKLGLS